MEKGNRFTGFALIIAAVFLIIPVLSYGEKAAETTANAKPENDTPALFYPVPASSGYFPCSKCHRYRTVDKTKRKLELAHTDIALEHDEKNRWCLDCHEGDKLKLANGKLIGYYKLYELCGQCHGTVYRDWKIGIHGKTTGMWDGERVYRVCVNCHDPHRPRFKQLEPEKQPMRPSEIKLDSR